MSLGALVRKAILRELKEDVSEQDAFLGDTRVAGTGPPPNVAEDHDACNQTDGSGVRMKRAILAMAVVGMMAGAAWVRATETENLDMKVLPAHSAGSTSSPQAGSGQADKVTVDGKIDDWDLSSGIFTCCDVENQREKFGVWSHAMYDDKYLYLLYRWTDETPMSNPGQAAGSYGWDGDCIQVRFITNLGKTNERVSHWSCWRDRDGVGIMDVAYGRGFNEGKIKDAQTQGAQQAFLINDDKKGYIQEMAIPWGLITKDDLHLKTGDAFGVTVEPNFTIGAGGRLTMKDVFRAGVVPDRVFTFRAYNVWGTAQLEAKGNLKPRSIRLSDGREFAVKLENGIPVIDWTGLIKSKELQGFKTISYTMPEDGFISLQIVNADGQVVRQLLNNVFMSKGKHDVKWDGLTTTNWRTPGQPVPAGTYTWRAIWHKDIGLRLRGWADNAGSAPWDSSPTANWGGDHGAPVACAAEGNKVFLGWSGAEAGKALLGCDLNGAVQWKNIRQGMAGAEYVAVDGGIVYAANWGDEGGNILYRVNAANGSYVDWGNGTPDLDPREIFPNPAAAPHRIDGLAAKYGKLYLSFLTANFRREQVTDWRAVLSQCKAGTGLAGEAWKRLDAESKKRAEKWLTENAPGDEVLKSPALPGIAGDCSLADVDLGACTTHSFTSRSWATRNHGM